MTTRGAVWCLLLAVAINANVTKNTASRLPRTSAGQLAAAAQNKTAYQLRVAKANGTISSTVGPPPIRGTNTDERYA